MYPKNVISSDKCQKHTLDSEISVIFRFFFLHQKFPKLINLGPTYVYSGVDDFLCKINHWLTKTSNPISNHATLSGSNFGSIHLVKYLARVFNMVNRQMCLRNVWSALTFLVFFVSNSPKWTVIWDNLAWWTQWAAVATYWLFSSTPPHW